MENTSLDEKVKNLEVELSQARTQIERMFSEKLDKVLSAQKLSSDKTSVGYVDSFGPSSSIASILKTVFVPQFEKVDKGIKSITDMSYSNTFVRPHSRKSSSSKTTHVCHHCGVHGKVIDSVPYRPVWSEYTIPASNPVRSTPLFRTGKNTGRTGKIWLYRPVIGYRIET